MDRKRLFTSLALLAVFLAGCAPATSTLAPVQPMAAEQTTTPSPAPVREAPAVGLTATYIAELPSATPPSDAQPVATSRGPDLQATDPMTVSLASGGLQLVEFFRFT